MFALSPDINGLFDISDKLNPVCLSQFHLAKDEGGYSSSILGLVNDKAFFSIGYSGIQVIDFSDEHSPKDLGMSSGTLIGGKWAFIADNYLITNLSQPVIYNITLPASFEIIFEFTHQIADFILLNNNLVCATLDDGIKIYDLSQPSRPILISSFGLNVVKFVQLQFENVVAEGVDGTVYFLDLVDMKDIKIITKIKVPGPIAANSILCEANHIFLRFMKKTAGDMTWGFNIVQKKSPKKVFEHFTPNTPLYVTNDNLLLFMGIKDWDGISQVNHLTKSLYKIFAIKGDTIEFIQDIELEGVWFGSVLLLENTIYVSRPDEVLIYKVTS